MNVFITLLMLVVGEVRFGELPPSKVTPSKPAPQQKSDLHSHLCSKCNHEWWHDPTKGPVSHNCPKCGRQQFVVNRTSPAGSRSTPLAAGLPSQQVGREPASKQKVVYVVGSTACYPCRLFKQQHGDGNEAIRYIYAYMNGGRPSHIDVATWNELVKLNNSGRFVYPFFVVKLADGEFVGAQAKVE